jgi:uncharacterized protein YjbJ (UPF0337 family)
VQRDLVRRLGKGVKSSRQDKGEGTKYTLKGMAKEATGALRADDAKRAKGPRIRGRAPVKGKR